MSPTLKQLPTDKALTDAAAKLEETLLQFENDPNPNTLEKVSLSMDKFYRKLREVVMVRTDEINHKNDRDRFVKLSRSAVLSLTNIPEKITQQEVDYLPRSIHEAIVRAHEQVTLLIWQLDFYKSCHRGEDES